MMIISSESSAGSKDDAMLEFGMSDSDWLEEFGCRHDRGYSVEDCCKTRHPHMAFIDSYACVLPRPNN